MAKGAKAKYTDKQKRQARHIETGYKRNGMGEREAVGRACATVNKIHGGGKKPGGSGYGDSRRISTAIRNGRKHRASAKIAGSAHRAISAKAAAPKRLNKRTLKTPKNRLPTGRDSFSGAPMGRRR